MSQIIKLLNVVRTTGAIQLCATTCNITKYEIMQILRLIRLGISVHTIALYNYRIGNSGANKIAKLLLTQPIINLHLIIDSIDRGLINIANSLYFNRTLKNLSICFIELDKNVVSALAHMLVQNKCLESMILEQNNMTSINCCKIIRSLKSNTSLKTLEIRDNDIDTCVIVTSEKMLRINKNLEALTLIGNNNIHCGANLAIKIDGSHHQSQHRQLDVLHIEAILIDQCCESIGNIILSANSFNLNFFMIDAQVMQSLIQIFNQYQIMINLTGTISCASFDSNSHTAARLLNILNQSETMVSLNLSDNFLADDNIVDLIVDILQRNNKLSTLKLSSTSIGHYNNKIFEELEYNEKLCELYLSANNIDMENIDHIVRFLRTNSAIKILDLSYNSRWNYSSKKISNSITNIFEALSQNETLHTLRLDGCETGNSIFYDASYVDGDFRQDKIDVRIDAVIKYMATNYTLINLGSGNHDETINYYLVRNKNCQEQKRFAKIKPVPHY